MYIYIYMYIYIHTHICIYYIKHLLTQTPTQTHTRYKCVRAHVKSTKSIYLALYKQSNTDFRNSLSASYRIVCMYVCLCATFKS